MMHFSLVPYKIAMAALRLSDSSVPLLLFTGVLYESVFQTEILYGLKRESGTKQQKTFC